MRVIIEGYDLPGRTFCDPAGAPLRNVHVGVQVRKQPEQLIVGDADTARWELAVEVVTSSDGSFDFKGPAVHGRSGDRFLYLTWGNVDADGEFDMFRRVKLMLDRIDPQLVRSADQAPGHLIGRIRLSDDHGAPRCARVDPPALEWATG